MIFDKKALLFLTCSAGVFFRAAAAAEGKSSKGTKGQSNPVPLYFLNPSSCPQKCAQCEGRFFLSNLIETPPVPGHGTGEAVQPCDAENKHQMWRLHQKDGLTMIESYFNPGDCLAVVSPQDGGTQLDHGVLAGGGKKLVLVDSLSYAGFFPPADVLGAKMERYVALSATQPSVLAADMCNGSVGLVPCNDPAAQWLFNGANLISALCWINGISSFMTVNEECSELSVMAADYGNDALLRSQTFMLTEQDFIKTIVLASNGVGTTIPSEIGALTDIAGHSGPGGEIPSELGQLPPVVGALLAPDHESGPAVEAKCDHTCDENKEVCAKHSPTEDGGKCYTKCPNDAETGRRCETPDDSCIHHYSHGTGITSWCECEETADGKEGDYEWVCKAK